MRYANMCSCQSRLLYLDFKRSLATHDLLLIRAAAAELPAVNLEDALEILPIIATAEPMTYEGRLVGGSRGWRSRRTSASSNSALR